MEAGFELEMRSTTNHAYIDTHIHREIHRQIERYAGRYIDRYLDMCESTATHIWPETQMRYFPLK